MRVGKRACLLVCLRACQRACVRASERASERASVRACVRAYDGLASHGHALCVLCVCKEGVTLVGVGV
jgi:hypothetical protein